MGVCGPDGAGIWEVKWWALQTFDLANIFLLFLGDTIPLSAPHNPLPSLQLWKPRPRLEPVCLRNVGILWNNHFIGDSHPLHPAVAASCVFMARPPAAG